MAEGKVGGAKKTKKQRKYGRNSTYCQYYRSTNKRERNKLRRALRRLVAHPHDNCLKSAIARYRKVLGIM